MPEPIGLAFKAYEIEELVNVRITRPLGMACARVAARLRMTPTAVTVAAMAVGTIGGALLYDPRWGLLSILLLMSHSVLDSSDGQLARMTGQTSEFGRLLDGLAGFVTHVAVYAAIVAGAVARGESAWIVVAALAAGASTLVHAMMYDYHRSSYTRVVIDGCPRRSADVTSHEPSGLLRLYERLEAGLAGRHPAAEAAVAAREVDGVARADDRARYRREFYRLVRGWNLMGDLVRFAAVWVLVALGRLDWFFPFVLVFMNGSCAVLWIWQARADRRFLAAM